MCAEVWPDTSGAINARYLIRSLEEGDKADFKELYNDRCDDTETSLFRS